MADTVSERPAAPSTQAHGAAALPPATDLYNVDSLLSEDERMVRDTVREFVAERVLPVIGEHFEAGTFPRELIPEVARLGLLGVHLQSYGPAGPNPLWYSLACPEPGFRDMGLPSFLSLPGS